MKHLSSIVAALALMIAACDHEPYSAAARRETAEGPQHPIRRALTDQDAELHRQAEEFVDSKIREFSDLKTIGTSELFQSTFGMEFSGPAIAAWLDQNIIRIRYIRDLKEEREKGYQTHAVNFSILGPQYQGWIGIGSSFMKEKRQTIELIADLIHEVWHSYPDKPALHQHVPCPPDFIHPELRGVNACDTDLGGAYGAELIFLREMLLNARNVPPKNRAFLARYVHIRADRILNPKDRQTILDGVPRMRKVSAPNSDRE